MACAPPSPTTRWFICAVGQCPELRCYTEAGSAERARSLNAECIGRLTHGAAESRATIAPVAGVQIHSDSEENMLDYREKRNYPRMDIDCPASFTVVDGKGWGAIVKNLSGGGVLMWIDHQIAADATPSQIEIKPVNDITPRWWLRCGYCAAPPLTTTAVCSRLPDQPDTGLSDTLEEVLSVISAVAPRSAAALTLYALVSTLEHEAPVACSSWTNCAICSRRSGASPMG